VRLDHHERSGRRRGAADEVIFHWVWLRFRERTGGRRTMFCPGATLGTYRAIESRPSHGFRAPGLVVYSDDVFWKRLKVARSQEVAKRRARALRVDVGSRHALH
jgi:hypothetical protein